MWRRTSSSRLVRLSSSGAGHPGDVVAGALAGSALAPVA